MILSWNLCSARFNTSHILDRSYKLILLSLRGYKFTCIKKKDITNKKKKTWVMHLRYAPLELCMCTIERGGIVINSHAVIMSMHWAIFPIDNSSGNIWLWNMVFSFYFIFFHSCRNLEVTALRRGTGRELLLRCWWF